MKEKILRMLKSPMIEDKLLAIRLTLIYLDEIIDYKEIEYMIQEVGKERHDDGRFQDGYQYLIKYYRKRTGKDYSVHRDVSWLHEKNYPDYE